MKKKAISVMLRCPQLRFILLLMMTISSSLSFAYPKFASLPGGLLYPQFASAAFTNAAALSADGYSEAQALYSPGVSNQSPTHSYLLGYGTSDPKYGFNLGYSGSIQSGVAAHNLFMGISRRIQKHSFGFSLRKNGLVFSNETPFDLSWNWNISTSMSMGAVIYDVFENRALALGLGYQDSTRNSLELDIQFPLPGYPSLSNREYSVNLASVIFLNETVGLSLGAHYQKSGSPNSESSALRETLGAVVKLKGQVSLVGLYNSSPSAFTLGLCWGSPAKENHQGG